MLGAALREGTSEMEFSHEDHAQHHLWLDPFAEAPDWWIFGEAPWAIEDGALAGGETLGVGSWAMSKISSKSWKARTIHPNGIVGEWAKGWEQTNRSIVVLIASIRCLVVRQHASGAPHLLSGTPTPHFW